MQITIDIPDQIVAVAAQRGQTPEDYVAKVVREGLAAHTERMEKVERFLRDFPIRDRELPVLPDSAFTRESIYSDHD